VKKASKAALLSGLIFPGIGHMVLKQYLRGSVLMLSALAAFSVIVTRVFQRALTIVDRINSGDVPVRHHRFVQTRRRARKVEYANVR